MINKLKITALLSVLVCLPAMANVSDTRVILGAKIGSQAGLGFRSPSVEGIASLEIPLTSRLELTPGFSMSPDRKAFSPTGHDIRITDSANFFLTRRFGVYGGIDLSEYWAQQPVNGYYIPLHKAGAVPYLGGVLRDSWDTSAPGRLYIRYLFPTGCVWASKCQLPTDGIQSNRTHGVDARQEFRLFQITPNSAMRFGIEGSWLNFCDQSNPQVITKRICHNTGTIMMSMTFEIGHLQYY